MKDRYDRDAVEQSFSVGDKVLILLPLSRYPFKARVHGLYGVARKASYLKTIRTLDRMKSMQMCHIKKLKPYYKKGKDRPYISDQRI